MMMPPTKKPTKRGSNLGVTTSPASKNADAEEARLKPTKKTSSGASLHMTSVEDMPIDRELSRTHEVSLTRRGSTGVI